MEQDIEGQKMGIENYVRKEDLEAMMQKIEDSHKRSMLLINDIFMRLAMLILFGILLVIVALTKQYALELLLAMYLLIILVALLMPENKRIE